MSNHTPGPFYAINGSIYKDFGDVRYRIADVDPYVWDDVKPIAHLMAAAPELLKALELAEKVMVDAYIQIAPNKEAGIRFADADPELQEIRAAINKAKGEQP